MEIEIVGKKRKVPDFMIAGGMKCGTTSLHHILNSHPLIFIPAPEIHFYDMDNYFQHQDSFIYRSNQWYYPNFTQDLDKSFDWYESWFKNTGNAQFLGEDSTIYLTSSIAHERIAKYAPYTKMIIMLRDPASRTYSQYSHLILTGRLSCSFEDAIQGGLGNLLDRSMYKKQIENFFKFLPRENFHFILFEEFVKDTQKITKQVLEFLEIPFPENFEVDQSKTHKNKSLVPRSITLQKLKNLLVKDVNNLRYAEFFAPINGFPVENHKNNQTFNHLINQIHRLINPRQNKKFPPMKPETKHFLNSYLKQQNEGLEKIIAKNLQDFWYK
jgi:hypothetical protein